jgi:hypothetical protein
VRRTVRRGEPVRKSNVFLTVGLQSLMRFVSTFQASSQIDLQIFFHPKIASIHCTSL